jgi:uncharacterized membrane protein YfcA
MLDIFSLQFLGLIVAGMLIGVFAVIVGGAMFIAIPIVQSIFPNATVGAVVGNFKVGSFFRSIGSTAATWRQIEFKRNFQLMPGALVGAIIGASAISHIDQKWMLPAIIGAILFTIYAPRLAHKVTNKTFTAAAFLTGLYAGVLGAGIGVMLVALLRLKHPKDTELGLVKIQARFVEFIITIAAVVTHIVNGNLIAALWVPLSIGSLAGGVLGGYLLRKMGELSGKTQKYILYAAFSVDLFVATKKFFE